MKKHNFNPGPSILPASVLQEAAQSIIEMCIRDRVKALVNESLNSLSIFIGLLAALKLSPYLVKGLEKVSGSNSPLIFLLGFALTFVLTLFLIRFLGNRFEDLLKAIKINFFNQVLGGAALSLIFLLLFSYGIWFADQVKFIPETTKKSSYTYTALNTLPNKSKACLLYTSRCV